MSKRSFEHVTPFVTEGWGVNHPQRSFRRILAAIDDGKPIDEVRRIVEEEKRRYWSGFGYDHDPPE